MTYPQEAGSAVTPSAALGVRAWLARRPWRTRSFWLRYSSFYGVIALIVVSSLLSPHFLTTENLLNVLRQWSMVALISVGMTFVIINRGIDVSGGAILALGCILGAAALPKVGVLAMIALVLMAGTACGLINGLAIIMDEPTAALGAVEAAKVLGLVRTLKDRGITVIVVSHNLQHVFSIADRIAVLRHGQMVGSVRPGETSGEAVVRMIVGADEAAVDLPAAPQGGR